MSFYFLLIFLGFVGNCGTEHVITKRPLSLDYGERLTLGFWGTDYVEMAVTLGSQDSVVAMVECQYGFYKYGATPDGVSGIDIPYPLRNNKTAWLFGQFATYFTVSIEYTRDAFRGETIAVFFRNQEALRGKNMYAQSSQIVPQISAGFFGYIKEKTTIHYWIKCKRV